MYLYNTMLLFAYLCLNSHREHASGRHTTEGKWEHFSDLSRHFLMSAPQQPSPSTSSWAFPTSYPHQTRWGRGPGEPVAESVGLLPTGSHYCAALPQIHSRWVSSYGLGLRQPLEYKYQPPSPSTWKPPWDLPQMKGEWEGWGFSAGLAWYSVTKPNRCL